MYESSKVLLEKTLMKSKQMPWRLRMMYISSRERLKAPQDLTQYSTLSVMIHAS